MSKFLRHSFFRVRGTRNSAQALVEFVLVSLILFVLLLGLIDFGRAIMVRQVLINVSREGANLASRGTSFTNTLDAMVVSANPLVINSKGYIILTSVTRDSSGALSITQQEPRGGIAASSRVGNMSGGPIHLPVTSIPQTNQTLTIAEVFYQYAPVTPIGQLLGLSLPSTLYDVSYF